MKKNSKLRATAMGLIGVMAVMSTGCQSKNSEIKKSPLDPQKPTTITIWNYYNGDQLTAFDSLVSEFNSTVGVEKGIAVDSVSQGSIDNLAEGLMESADQKVGSQELPTLASIYAETAFILDQKDLLVNLDDYFSEEELSAYIPEFIEEGRFVEGGELLLFPISKSTECFAVNATDWKEFEAATGNKIDDINSVEKLTDVAQQYYEWTDSLTPDVLEDGKALYGRDSIANYIFISTAQLGHEMFDITKDGVSVDLNRDVFKKLWDNYYIPYINGYFVSAASHRSEDMKTGTILAMTGSTSGISYLPTAVTDETDVSHDIDVIVKKPLNFSEGEEIAVQQGAGYCVIKGTPAQQYAAVEFLKWFTESERNLKFSVSSGYSAVTTAANQPDKINTTFVPTSNTAKDKNMLNALLTSADVYMNERTYTTKPFEGSKDVRNILQYALSDIATADREAVVAAIALGQTREQATAFYSSDEYFDAWFNDLCTQVTQAVQ